MILNCRLDHCWAENFIIVHGIHALDTTHGAASLLAGAYGQYGGEGGMTCDLRLRGVPSRILEIMCHGPRVVVVDRLRSTSSPVRLDQGLAYSETCLTCAGHYDAVAWDEAGRDM